MLHNYKDLWPAESGILRCLRRSHNKHAKVRATARRTYAEPGTGRRSAIPKFCDSEFFDASDIVQVKYEQMPRRVSVENASVVNATEEYGVSRPTYYQARTSFEESGIAGLVPRKRGLRGPHKLQGRVLGFIQVAAVAGEPIRARELAKQIREEIRSCCAPQGRSNRAIAVKKTAR